jgi:hypothetical protein
LIDEVLLHLLVRWRPPLFARLAKVSWLLTISFFNEGNFGSSAVVSVVFWFILIRSRALAWNFI